MPFDWLVYISTESTCSGHMIHDTCTNTLGGSVAYWPKPFSYCTCNCLAPFPVHWVVQLGLALAS